MDVRSKRKRRIAILLFLLALIVIGVAVLHSTQKWRRQVEASKHRAEAMNAAAALDYPAAIKHFQKYFRNDVSHQDADAIYAYAKARLKEPSSNNWHLEEAIKKLREVLRLQDNVQAAHDLLNLYVLLGPDHDALDLVEHLLKKDPTDLAAIRAKAIVLSRIGRQEAALKAGEQVLKTDPLDIHTQMLVLELRHQLEDDSEELVQYVEQLRLKYKNEPRFDLLQGFVYALIKNSANMNQWLDKAALQTPPDENYTTTLVWLLDQADKFPKSLEVLTSAPRGQIGLHKEAARRLFEAYQFEAFIDLFDRMGQPNQDMDLLALKALSLHQLQRTSEAKLIVENLDKESAISGTDQWKKVLKEVLTPKTKNEMLIKACIQALKSNPYGPYFEYLLANAYAAHGEKELELKSWLRVAELRPSWAEPRVQAARLLLNMGQVHQAREIAEQGLRRAPNSLNAAVTLALTQGANLERINPDATDRLLDFINQIQKTSPGEEHTLRLRLSILADAGRMDEVRKLIEQLVAGDQLLNESLLLHLARTSTQFGLDLESDCYDKCEQLWGSTSNLELAKAKRFAESGRSQEGLSSFESAMQRSSESEQMTWRSAWAHYLDLIDDPRAYDQWVTLADDFPDRADIQQLILRASSVQTDRSFTARVIKRLKQLSGTNSIGWRLEHARWLLNDSASDQNTTEAASLLREIIADAPHRIEPHLLLAGSLEQLGRVAVAVQAMKKADQAIPNSALIQLERARLYQALRQFPNAREQLERVVTNRSARPEERRRAAIMLAQQGDFERPIQILENTTGTNPHEDNALLLAGLYHRIGRIQEAEAICKSLTENPTVKSVGFVADFYASLERHAEAQEVLALCKQIDSDPGTAEIVFCDHYTRHHSTNQAQQQLQTAVETVPTSIPLWYRLISFYVMNGKVEQAIAAITKAHQLLPDDKGLAILNKHQSLLRQTSAEHWSRPLLGALVNDPPNRLAATEALRAVAQSNRNGPLRMDLVHRLRQLADQHLNFLAIQTVTTQFYLDRNEPKPAVALAERTMRRFPTSAESAWLAAESLAADNRWVEALIAARKWRRRIVMDAFKPDMMIAEARLRLGEPQSAMDHIKPYLQRALANPDKYPQVLDRYARILISTGRTNEAAKILMPLVKRSVRWAITAIKLAALAIQEETVAIEWIEQAGISISPDAVDGQLVLARGWWAIAHRFDDHSSKQQARHVVEQLNQTPNATAESWQLQGMMADQDADSETAEHAYRAALEFNPLLIKCKNNLAALLADSDATCEEALKLAQQVVEAEPSDPNFLDTLATVQLRSNQCDQAITTIQQAIDMQPDKIEWQRNKGEILSTCGHHEEANRLREELERKFPNIRDTMHVK